MLIASYSKEKFIMKTNLMIKRLRKEKGMTQEELAERLNVSLMTVRRWEWGNTSPNSKMLVELADVLGTTPEKLLSDDTEENDTFTFSEKERSKKTTLRNTGNLLVYERNGERMELPPTQESYEIFRQIASIIAKRESVQPVTA